MSSSSEKISIEDADNLVLEHRSWAESIARSVARAWNLDWQSDGLDGAAMEALIFCSRRFDASRGVPFKGYSRKRIHEASSDAARKCKNWRRSSSKDNKLNSKDLSVDLLNVFPELRSGSLPNSDEWGDDTGEGKRHAVRQLLVGATILAAKQEAVSSPDELLDYKRMISVLALLEPVHQELVWKLYWEGESMRSIATGWDTDELNVIREHKVLLTYMLKSITSKKPPQVPRIRPGLKTVALKLKRKLLEGQFKRLISDP